MASHGVSRISDGPPKTDDARKVELQKIQIYQELVERVVRAVQEQAFTLDTLQLTTKLLKDNPEYYTIWNYRRRILQQMFYDMHKSISQSEDHTESTSEEIKIGMIKDRISDDLRLLERLLREYPKCYWIWNHRSWLLQQSVNLLPRKDSRLFWDREFALVGKMLARDNRNFHGWGYRRKVVAALESKELRTGHEATTMAREEFDYTTRMIKVDLSNFSAWHYRSKLIPRMLDRDTADDGQRKAVLDEELRWIQHSLYADPDDQSLWSYYQYMITAFDPPRAKTAIAPNLTKTERVEYLKKELEKYLELLDIADDCKWIYQTLIQLAMTFKKLTFEWPEQAQEIGSWLTELQKLDPLRSGRWNDLEKVISKA